MRYGIFLLQMTVIKLLRQDAFRERRHLHVCDLEVNEVYVIRCRLSIVPWHHVSGMMSVSVKSLRYMTIVSFCDL